MSIITSLKLKLRYYSIANIVPGKIFSRKVNSDCNARNPNDVAIRLALKNTKRKIRTIPSTFIKVVLRNLIIYSKSKEKNKPGNNFKKIKSQLFLLTDICEFIFTLRIVFIK